MSQIPIAKGTVHNLTKDITQALSSDSRALEVWQNLTPLARNEWICWVTYVSKEETRIKHVKRMITELKEGKKRPCCWLGCIHRTDKKISPSVKGILSKKVKN